MIYCISNLLPELGSIGPVSFVQVIDAAGSNEALRQTTTTLAW